MQFNREPNYFNRYSRSSDYQEWRALAGEVPQAAEFNEVQALLKDKIQQTGEAIFQSGDIISGMLLTPKQGAPKVYQVSSTENKIWIDGSVHPVKTASDLAAVEQGWGFIGVYLERFTVDHQVDPQLRDPAIYDASGSYLGLPGANRLKVVPVWVAGSLCVSDFTENKIRQTIGIARNSNNYVELFPSVDVYENVASTSSYNAKYTINRSDIISLSLVHQEAISLSNKAGSTIKATIKVKTPSGSSLPSGVTAKIAVFNLADKSQAQVSATPVEVSSAGVSVPVSLNLTSNLVQGLNAQYYVGVFLSSPAALPNGTEVFLSDLHILETAVDNRKPVFTSFKASNGSTYSNFIPGPSSFITVGSQQITETISSVGGTPLVGTSGTNSHIKVPSKLLSAGINDVVIRETEVTPAADSEFLNSFGVRKEEAFIRIYPVHITKDGQIVSSLPNREFTKLNNNYFSERFKNVISTKTISSPIISKQGTNSVKVTVSDAFVDGRYIVTQPTVLELPVVGSLDVFTYARSFDYAGKGIPHSLFTEFTSISNATVTCLFVETHNRNQPEIKPFIELLADEKDMLNLHVFSTNSNDPAKISSVKILNIRNGSTNKDALQAANSNVAFGSYVLEYTTVVKETGTYTYPTIKWLNNAQDTNEPRIGQRYTVYYEATISLTPGLDESNSLANLTYEENNKTQFKLKHSDLSQAFSPYAGYFDKISYLSLTAYLVSPQNPIKYTLPVKDESTREEGRFYSTINLGSIETTSQNKAIIYLAGNYEKDGPDGYFGYQLVKSEMITQASLDLLKQNKLPVGWVNPANTNEFQAISYTGISQNEQLDVNAVVTELKDYLPVILSQNLLSSNSSGSSPVISYKKFNPSVDGGQGPAEDLVVNTIQWKVNPVRFPSLANYTVTVDYDYYGETEPSAVSSLDVNHVVRKAAGRTDKKFYGLLRSIGVKVKTGTAGPISEFTAVVKYNTNLYEGESIKDITAEVDSVPLITNVEIIEELD